MTEPIGRPLLRLDDLARWFEVSPPILDRLIERRQWRWLKAVDGVSFAIRRGETFSLVGESGCGKSTVARVVVGLYQPTRGSVEFDGVNIADPASREDKIRRRMQMIFQDPFASLNPRWRARDIIPEPIRAHRLARSRAQIRAPRDPPLPHLTLPPLLPYRGRSRERLPARGMSGRPRAPAAGEAPTPLPPPSGCAFHPRCPFANARCRSEPPELRAHVGALVACHAVEEDRLPPPAP